MIAITVAPNSGIDGWEAASMAAFLGSIPSFMRTTIPSATTMELSTIIPRAIIRAPRDMRCRSIPKIAIRIKLVRIVRISDDPMTTPIRHPMARVRTIRTMATASPKLIRNPFTAWFTMPDCQ